MKSTFENDILTIYAQDSVDTTNAEAFGSEIDEIRSRYPNGQLVLDVEELKYMLSPGPSVVRCSPT